MDWSILVFIASLAFCSVIFVFQAVSIVKFVVNCKREGVKIVKPRISVSTVIFVALTIWFSYEIVYYFNRANECKKGVEYAESMIGTDYVDYYAKEQEKKKGIVILDPEQYYLNNIEYTRSNMKIYTIAGIGFIVWDMDGILTLIGTICVITGKGFRNFRIKDAIPIFAEYDKQNGKIIIKANDLTGKAEKLFTVPANPKNLASLGQFIVWDEEQTIQEETL